MTTPRLTATKMAEAAQAWLERLDDEQRSVGQWTGPTDDASEAERRRWFYTPTDHGGLTGHQQRPAQQRAAMTLVGAGLSEAGYVTVATTIGLENVLDRAEGFVTRFDRERGRDPGLYYLRVFGTPGDTGAWGYRFGGHHVSLNNLVVDGELVATTPCFMGADPAVSPLLGGALNRPLARVEDLARELVRSLSPELGQRAVLLPKPPSDFVTANRTTIGEGDRVIPLAGIWRDDRFPDDTEQDKLQALSDSIDDAAGYTDEDHELVAYSAAPRGVPGASSTAASATCCGRCSAPTSAACPRACHRWRRTTMPRSTPCISRGPARSSRARRTTTGCRARGCSSSGTTPSAAQITPTRSGGTRSLTSASTCWPDTGPTITRRPRRRHDPRRRAASKLVARSAAMLTARESP